MVNFDINGKVALITGGAAGIGFNFAIQLLEKGAKGVTLADIVPENGRKAIEEIEAKFGKNKAIFVQTDVTNYEQFDNAFKKTINAFNNVDILINNAGICDESDQRKWPKVVEVNLNGTINGILLGLDNYLPKHKSGAEGLIVNVASILGISPCGGFPIYAATKFATHGLTLSFGLPAHYERTKVRVVAVCPGVTLTSLFLNLDNKSLGPDYIKLKDEEFGSLPEQTSDQLAVQTIKIVEKAPPGTMWVVEGGEPYQFVLPDRFSIPKVYLE